MKRVVGKKGTIALAISIADDAAITTIDCYSTYVRDRIGRILWREIDPDDPSDGWHVSRAARYLEFRGKLRRNPKNRNQVKVLLEVAS